MIRRRTSQGGQAGWGARLLVLLLSGLFAGVFGLVGIVGGLKPLALMLHGAWDARDWQPVPVEILGASLNESHHRKSRTQAVQARYRYTFGGQAYEGWQVGLDGGIASDNLDDWHQRWLERLNAAQAGGPQLLAWVDPRDPTRALLDRQLRWRKILVHLPFALVFSAVSLGAALVFWRALRLRREAPDPATDEAEPVRPPARATLRRSVRGDHKAAWVLAFAWCGIAFPLSTLALTGSDWWWGRLLALVFIAAGLALLALAVHLTRQVWRYADSTLALRPDPPRAGERLELLLTLSPRAAAAWQDTPLRLRLAQYRVDDSRSGAPERRVEAFEHSGPGLPTPDGGLTLRAAFSLPQDAPTHGGQRSGERVDWRLELLQPDNQSAMRFPVPVRAAQDQAARRPEPDRFAPRSPGAHEEPVPLPVPEHTAATDRPPRLPAGVFASETPEAWSLHFPQSGPRWTALLALVPLGVLIHYAVSLVRQGLAPLSPWSWQCLVMALLLALVLHGLTCRWELQVRDDGLLLRRSSWLWWRSLPLPVESTRQLFHKQLFSTRSAHAEEQPYHALHTRWPDAEGTRLTPGLPDTGPALAVAAALRWAQTQRRARFAPGAQRSPLRRSSHPRWGWLVWLVLMTALLQLPHSLGPARDGAFASGPR